MGQSMPFLVTLLAAKHARADSLEHRPYAGQHTWMDVNRSLWPLRMVIVPTLGVL